MTRAFHLLAHLKILRGTPLDVFSYSDERRMERDLIKQYEADLPRILAASNSDAAVALAELPLQIRGFGPVKEANERKAAKRREELLAMLDAQNLSQAAE